MNEPISRYNDRQTVALFWYPDDQVYLAVALKRNVLTDEQIDPPHARLSAFGENSWDALRELATSLEMEADEEDAQYESTPEFQELIQLSLDEPVTRTLTRDDEEDEVAWDIFDISVTVEGKESTGGD